MKIGPKISSIAGGVFFILLFSGYSSFICVQDLIDSNKSAMKTVKTLRELENILGRVADLESTGRGYILSGDKDFVQQNEASLKEVTDSIDTLKELTKDEPERAKYLAELLELIQSKVDFCKNLMNTMRLKGAAEATALFKTERGRILMDEIRHKVSDRVAFEEDLLQKQQANSKATANNTFFAIISGGILALVFISLWSLIIIQGLLNPIQRLSRAMDKAGAGRFEPVTGIDTRDELEDLSNTFNNMISGLRRIEETYIGTNGNSPTHALGLVRQHTHAFGFVINDLLEASRQLVNGYEGQPDELQASLDQIRNLSKQSKETCDLIEAVAQKLSRSDELRRSGHRTLDEIDEQVNKVLTEADSSVQRVKGLAETIHDLDGLSVIMDDMANRVGMLSLSSQIEAKKNSGSGFEAFADEMKDLSERLRHESVKVKHLLMTMERSVHRAAGDNEQAQEVMRKAITAIGQLHNKLDALLEPVTEAGQQAQSLEERLERQKHQIMEFQHTLERANLTSEQKQFFIKQINCTAEEVNNFGSELNHLLEKPIAS
ncbi:MAG TPA: CHASE3 domain-containing protein [Candidatus Melainabacteria bacterium]|nr:CHASE3 domain-containing protein [Candidatus Melainabacteria bacterium]